MEDLPRLIISDERIKYKTENNLILTTKESHYLNNVMRLKPGENIYVVNGKGLLWKGEKINENTISIPSFDNPFLNTKKKTLLLGLAIALPKKGFEDVLKMSTEIGIDFIRPLYTDRQIKKISNITSKNQRWDSIINESVEQCERLWKPQIEKCIYLNEWIDSVVNKDMISISITRQKNSLTLKEWLNLDKTKFHIGKKIVWNVIGPEGGWSQKELTLFESHKLQTVRLSQNILRTSTAAISASVSLSQWRDQVLNKL